MKKSHIHNKLKAGLCSSRQTHIAVPSRRLRTKLIIVTDRRSARILG